jgi:menaquinone-dependent protoporphyrinogen oxidase
MDGPRIAIVFDSQEGQTERIAAHIAARARKAGFTADLFPTAAEVAGLASYDAIIIGGSVHAGRHGRRLVRFVRESLADLERIPSAFFSVSLSAATPDEQHHADALRAADAFARETGWEPRQRELVAGALRYSRYGFLKRFLMRRIMAKEGTLATSGDHEYTDWAAVEAFTDAFLQRLPPPGHAPDGNHEFSGALV